MVRKKQPLMLYSAVYWRPHHCLCGRSLRLPLANKLIHMVQVNGCHPWAHYIKYHTRSYNCHQIKDVHTAPLQTHMHPCRFKCVHYAHLVWLCQVVSSFKLRQAKTVISWTHPMLTSVIVQKYITLTPLQYQYVTSAFLQY